MTIYNYTLIFVLLLLSSCQNQTDHSPKETPAKSEAIVLDLKQANRLAKLPIECISNPLPYKSGIVIATEEDLKMPIVHHPAFYGCFDWHSAVHGHWSLIYLMKQFPELDDTKVIRAALDKNLTKENIQKEIEYFSLNKYSKSFERTYGWAWLLKLAEELKTWDDPDAKKWLDAIRPLADHISNAYIEYLPKLVYPIRVGEHTNSAFGLSFAYDYAVSFSDTALKDIIVKRAKDFYMTDQNCPINWEPSGYDFLSPCLQEMDIMRKVLSESEFENWIGDFLPSLVNGTLHLEPGKIKDRSDGKLVHLDGLNFSRAWCLYSLGGQYHYGQELANAHLKYSLNKITDGDYAGQHWLASFALYAFKTSANQKTKAK